MNNITVSLETAKKLKEAGWEKETLFYYSEQLSKTIIVEQFLSYEPFNINNLLDDGFREAVEKTYALPTAQEILDELPKKIIVDTNKMRDAQYYLDIGYTEAMPGIVYTNDDGNYYLHIMKDFSLVEGLAEVRLRCKENGYLSTLPKE